MNTEKKLITIRTTDFTNRPSVRFETQWDNSGEEFYEKYIKKHLKNINDNTIIEINLDGVLFGYPPSFISEVFGRLYLRLHNDNNLQIWDNMKIISNEDPSIITTIREESPSYEFDSAKSKYDV